MKIFITATGTDVGKTYVSALIAKNLAQNGVNVGYFKPLASGNLKTQNGVLIADDAKFVRDFAGLKSDIFTMFGYAFKEPYSPHLAAKIENFTPNKDEIVKKITELEKHYEILIIEGSGGVVCPFGEFMQIDLIKELNCDVLLVSSSNLGAINSAVLSTSYLKNEGIKTKGIILNNFNENLLIHSDNAVMIERLCGVKILAKVANESKEILGLNL
ncbi:dethiobiotin synthase [Campylobacter gastrosuis]|uniref:ATP-dependent dethiobiotin synthetase BioD n=1 Tax=Campylobacter gastrosuis TaxID=2974576 RepID=A0ABT7HQQ9_9BACT|nr:dethiobiotin synthase [Campylobacter gastrosuis]MDL0088729.1 dethiobiotin synthase [Campylobacter gastrosuis]